MATGALSSLGIGSNLLTYDIIDKLREVDNNAKIKPLDKKSEENLTKQKDLTEITNYLNSLKSAASALSSDTVFQGREVSTTGESATLTADAGVAVSSVSVDVINIATKDIYQTNAQKSSTTSLGLSAGEIKLKIGSGEYEIKVTSSTTLTDLAEKINDASNGNIQAKILNVGGENPYRLIIQSADTGEKQAISFEGDEDILSELGLNELGVGEANEGNHLSVASDALFKYDGVTMQRASNTIDDITVGITLNLIDEGKSNFDIKQNKGSLSDEMEKFVEAYNNLMNNLNVTLDYDEETGKSGSLQGVSEVVTIRSDLNRVLTSMDIKGRSLDSYGLSLQEGGLLKFNKADLEEKLAQNPQDVEDFFKGMLTFDPTKYIAKSAMSAGELNIESKDFEINGVGISFSSDASASAADNAKNLRDAINSAGIKGLVASLDTTGERLILTSNEGSEITIKGNSSTLNKIGLSATTIRNDGNQSEGVFGRLGKVFDNLLGNKGSLTLLDNELTNSQKRLKLERERSVAQLDSKYQTMIAQFAAYDSIIAGLNQQFSSLQSMIDAQLNAKK
ncbi:MAG: flagellar filament capping protein FliD [Sulfurospirillaceae bacterium]|nr:flagellar filament capping protein FliD [Sulfurospirillaceae bacterium]